MTERPHDIDIEQALIGAVLTDNAALHAASSLEPEDFFDPLHAYLFAGLRELARSGAVVTALTARGLVEKCPSILPGLPVAEYLKRLLRVGISPAGAATVASQIRDLAARRRMIDAAETMIASAHDRAIDLAGTASDAVSDLNDVLATIRVRQRSDTTIGDAARVLVDRLADGEVDAGLVPTGLHDLDRMLGGWPRGGLSLLAGRPSMGKTTLATSIMLNVAKAKRGVVFFSLEMPTPQLTARVLADLSFTRHSPIAYADVMRGNLGDRERTMFGEAAGKLGRWPLVIDDQRGLTVAEIGARVRKHQAAMERDGVSLDLVMIDHLGLVKPSSRYSGNRVQEITELSDGLATIARDTNTAVVALSQLNRAVEGRENKRPGLSDLRDSGALEQDADVVVFAFRPAYYLERTQHDAGTDAELKRQTLLEATRNTMEAIVAKQRNGETGVVSLFAHMPSNAVRDLAA